MFTWGDLGAFARTRPARWSRATAPPRCCPAPTAIGTASMANGSSRREPNRVGNTTGGSWHGVLLAGSPNQEAAYSFLALMAIKPVSLWAVQHGWTGINPGFAYQMLPPTARRGSPTTSRPAGTGPTSRTTSTAFQPTFNAPTMLPYLRIRGTPAYWSALDSQLAAALGGRKTAQAGPRRHGGRLGQDHRPPRPRPAARRTPKGHRLHAGAILASPWRCRDRPGVRPAPVLCPPCPARPLQEHGSRRASDEEAAMGAVPSEMAFIRIDRPGPPEVLVPDRMAFRQPGPGEVLIQVAAAGINRPDVLQRQGGYPPPPGASDVPGLEVAGEVVALGAERGALAGRRPGHGAGQLGRLRRILRRPGAAGACRSPHGCEWSRRAAVPETFFTVWTNVFDRGRLQPGESFLVHGGSSGIGTTAIQLAHAFGATRVRHRRQRRQAARLRGAWAPSARSTTATRISSRSSRPRPAAAGSTSSWTWSAAPMSSATCRRSRVEGRLVQIAWLQGAKIAGQLHAADAQAADLDRLDPAAAPGRAEGGDRPRAGGARSGRCWRPAR